MTQPGTSRAETAQSFMHSTGGAPSLPAPASVFAGDLVELLAPGRCFDDFEILRSLGTGSFARVLLARQRSLDRLVALKATTNESDEARTLASLEHAHIVQVFSETVYPQYGLRLLCMQYVPGLTLARIIEVLAHRDPATWSGRTILDILDTFATEPTAFDPAALESRAELESCDFPQAVCRLGARLAEALAHAHAHGVLHLDLKPANVLVNRYGRPFLADFNIARVGRHRATTDDAPMGGTLGYMAPEHLDAFRTASAGVDERSDHYSLGVVLFELLTGRLPHERRPEKSREMESLREMAIERRAAAPSPAALRAEIPAVLDRVVRRCLEPEGKDRYATAAELAQALEGCRELRAVERQLPPPHVLMSAAARRPYLFIALLTLVPHFLGSAVNIPYNALRIVNDLTEDQKTCFGHLVLGYNLFIYPLCIALQIWVVRRLARGVRALRPAAPNRADAATVRRHALTMPGWAIGLGCLGWLPGGLLFPLGLHVFSDPVPPEAFGHFLVSFTISGLIALTYSYFGVLYLTLHLFYPRLWSDPAELRRHAQAELADIPGRVRLFQLLAGVIPLSGAILMIVVGPDELTRTFRLLVTALIALGLLGFGVTLLVSGRVLRIHALFTGPQ